MTKEDAKRFDEVNTENAKALQQWAEAFTKETQNEIEFLKQRVSQLEAMVNQQRHQIYKK